MCVIYLFVCSASVGFQAEVAQNKRQKTFTWSNKLRNDMVPSTHCRVKYDWGLAIDLKHYYIGIQDTTENRPMSASVQFLLLELYKIHLSEQPQGKKKDHVSELLKLEEKI